MKQQNVHYFPGHMRKALNAIREYVKLVDLVVIVCDARAPLATQNPYLYDVIKDKKRMVVLSKSDIADPEITKQWVASFAKEGTPAMAGDLKNGRILAQIGKTAEPLFAAKREKEDRLGMKRQPLRMMVVGVPNVGKSTFINSFRGNKKAKVANKAGYTRSEQWIRVSEQYLLLDTPGILPMNYEEREKAMTLAILGTMKEEVLPQEEIAYGLLKYLRIQYPFALKERFDIDDLSAMEDDDILLEIAKKRGLLESGIPSLNKASYLLVKEFKDGILGRYSLESPDA
ncbi:MAG: ribosome biogenesis GTPase YlqF [Bacilli bacterium]|nr:ribosome biogenesis GTPase YlqF [Bacilli bacterium]